MQKLVLKKKEEEVAEIQFADLLGIGMTLVVLVIGLAYGADIVADVGDDMTENTTEYNVTVDGLSAIKKLASKLSMIMTVMVAAVIIGLLIRYLWVQNFG